MPRRRTICRRTLPAGSVSSHIFIEGPAAVPTLIDMARSEARPTAGATARTTVRPAHSLAYSGRVKKCNPFTINTLT